MLLPVVSFLAHQQEEYVSAANISSKPGRSRGFKCLLWVKSRHRGIFNQCPLYPQKRTLELSHGMSALCQKRTLRWRHSITSSANVRRFCGILRPIAFAALEFIVSSNLVGCCTGKSTDLVPLSKRPV